jgi:serine/threonine-protein kinase
MDADGRLGTTLGAGWRLETVLGRGGTSTVYSATHARVGTHAAVKVFHRDLAQRPRVLKILLSEARLVAAVNHPGTVRVLDDGVAADGCAFLVFELLVGQTLEGLRQASGGRIPLDEVMPIGDAIMDALAAVHEAGIVHRDLKPANIFILTGGGVKLLDFGFAKLRGYTAEAAQHVVGTPSFMAPEAALGLTKKMDAQTDVWSLGATLFHVLSGQPVHLAEHMEAMILATASSRPRSLADAAPELSSKLVNVIDRALSYRKVDRWPDIRSMREAWQAAHPHWLPTLPPPVFDADPEFLDSSFLVPEPPSDLFDPREIVLESARAAEMAETLPPPNSRDLRRKR